MATPAPRCQHCQGGSLDLPAVDPENARRNTCPAPFAPSLLRPVQRLGYFFHPQNELFTCKTVECAVLGPQDIHKSIFLSDHRPVMLGVVL